MENVETRGLYLCDPPDKEGVMKKCSKCGEVKMRSAFGFDRYQSTGLKPSCRDCVKLFKRNLRAKPKIPITEKACCRCKQVKVVADFFKSVHARDGYLSSCKACEKERIFQEKAARTDYQAKRYQEKTKEMHLLKKYGLRLDTRHKIYIAQDGKCALCLVPHDEFSLSVDHCHTTEVVRGLLCMSCNVGIGKLKDNPGFLRRAADYIEFHRSGAGAFLEQNNRPRLKAERNQ